MVSRLAILLIIVPILSSCNSEDDKFLKECKEKDEKFIEFTKRRVLYDLLDPLQKAYNEAFGWGVTIKKSGVSLEEALKRLQGPIMESKKRLEDAPGPDLLKPMILKIVLGGIEHGYKGKLNFDAYRDELESIANQHVRDCFTNRSFTDRGLLDDIYPENGHRLPR